MDRVKNSNAIILGLILICLSVTFISSAQETNYDSLVGEWDVETEDGQFMFVFTFAVEEDSLTGVFGGPTGDLDMEDISFEDNELMFTVTIDAGGQILVADFSATIEDNSMEGFVSTEMGELNFSGKKRE